MGPTIDEICWLEFSEFVPDDRSLTVVKTGCFEFLRKTHIMSKMRYIGHLGHAIDIFEDFFFKWAHLKKNKLKDFSDIVLDDRF